jgi:hypothetical protein
MAITRTVTITCDECRSELKNIYRDDSTQWFSEQNAVEYAANQGWQMNQHDTICADCIADFTQPRNQH